jgi:copper oxidase (laccase) domain-containing protein
MARLEPFYLRLLDEQGLGDMPVITAEQVHGNKIALVDTTHRVAIPGADGLITRSRGITLGITVADCAPVWIVAKDGTVGALLHSGKKGTKLGIVPEGIRALCALGIHVPADFVVVIGPCIRPDCYEVDFAMEIRCQAAEAGIVEIYDTMICTACHPHRYYSYRRELGRTGRMLATLTLLP